MPHLFQDRKMPRGTIKKLARLPSPLERGSHEDGYGVIEGDRQEVFFLASAVTCARFTELKVGQPVDFEVEPGPLGRAARVVPFAEAAPVASPRQNGSNV